MSAVFVYHPDRQPRKISRGDLERYLAAGWHETPAAFGLQTYPDPVEPLPDEGFEDMTAVEETPAPRRRKHAREEQAVP